MPKPESDSGRSTGEGPASASSTGSSRGAAEDQLSASGRPILDAADETAQLLKQLTIGTVVDGKYKIDEIIGRGAMGVVVAATHVHLRERVALKFLSAKAHPHSTDFHSRFRREAQVSAKLRNEHITRVIDVGVWRDLLPFMVMDHLTGDDLRRVLKTHGKIPTATALDYVVQLCEGLAEAHALGIVHRDLKPSNLFVTRRPDGTELIKILDFGISKWSQGEDQVDELTQTGVVLGSPKYMAPEQLFGSSDVDPRADVWSIGAIFYEMLAGRPPFDFPTLTRICAELATDKAPPPLSFYGVDVAPELEAAILRCFVRDRDKRIRNVAELAGALLESVDAPFASQVQGRLATILDPKGQPPSMMTTSGGMPMSGGTYLSLSMTGSTPGRMSSSSALRLASAANAPSLSVGTTGGVESEVAASSNGTRRGIVVGAIIGVLMVAAVAIFFMSGPRPDAGAPRSGRPPTGTAVVTEPPVAQPPAPAATAAAMVPGTAAPSASAAPASASPGNADSQPASHASGGGGGWHPPHHSAPSHAAAPPAPATAAPAPPPVAPTPAPAPTPTTKANPLEDRQ